MRISICMKVWGREGSQTERFLRLRPRSAGVRVAADDTWSDIFSRVLSQRVEPELGAGRATILYDYPASEAALAQASPDDPRIADRFELYCCGIELANAFHELRDAKEQRLRFEADMAEQERIYGTSAPIDEDFLEALGHMPELVRGCARVRPRCHAGDRRGAGRRCSMDSRLRP